MKIIKVLLGTVALAVLMLPGTSSAELKSGVLTFSPMLGGIVMEGDQNVEENMAYSLGLGYNFTKAFGTELVLAGANLERDRDDRNIDLVTYRLDALYHFTPDNALVPYVAAGLGGYDLDGDGEVMAEYGAGLLYFIAENVALRADVRHLAAFNESRLENNLLYTAGLKFQFAGPAQAPAPAPAPAPVAAPIPVDSDGDGVPDTLDQCPGTPKGVKVDSKGCPLDSDGDGVPDYLDQCPDTPKGAKVDGKGCPLDSDGDGVPDHLDQCPDTPKGVKVDEKGCPLDSDGDGVPDHLDQCPDTPKGVKVDEKGCPLDSDGDGVPDHLDRCPDTPRGILVDENGCEIKMTLYINFDTDRAEIKAEHASDLQKAAAFINRYPGTKILVAGHTDSIGSNAYNQGLSERRANAVRSYLASKHGIEGDRLFARGYGEERPAADNGTSEGRSRNRRVELICCTVIPE